MNLFGGDKVKNTDYLIYKIGSQCLLFAKQQLNELTEKFPLQPFCPNRRLRK
jgi:hypothetical protein